MRDYRVQTEGQDYTRYVELTVATLTDCDVVVGIDDDMYPLGATELYQNFFIVSVNVALHVEMFGGTGEMASQLNNTIRHEVAHVEHQRSLMPAIVELADSVAARVGPGVLRYDGFFNAAAKAIMTGKDSDHGYNWRKWARKLGATPTARVKVGV